MGQLASGKEHILTICTAKTPWRLFIYASATGTTSALAFISEPTNVRPANEFANKATFEVLVRPLANICATGGKATTSTLKAGLEPSLLLAKHPRNLVQVVVQCLSAPRAESSSWGSTSGWEGGSTLSTTTVVAAQWEDVLLLPVLINAVLIRSLQRELGAYAQCRRRRVRGLSRSIDASSQSTSEPHVVLDPSEEEDAQLQAGGCFAILFLDGADLQQDAESQNGDCLVWLEGPFEWLLRGSTVCTVESRTEGCEGDFIRDYEREWLARKKYKKKRTESPQMKVDLTRWVLGMTMK